MDMLLKQSRVVSSLTHSDMHQRSWVKNCRWDSYSFGVYRSARWLLRGLSHPWNKDVILTFHNKERKIQMTSYRSLLSSIHSIKDELDDHWICSSVMSQSRNMCSSPRDTVSFLPVSTSIKRLLFRVYWYTLIWFYQWTLAKRPSTVFSLSSHRHSFIGLVFTSHFIDS